MLHATRVVCEALIKTEIKTIFRHFNPRSAAIGQIFGSFFSVLSQLCGQLISFNSVHVVVC